jgi:hypothetical protein
MLETMQRTIVTQDVHRFANLTHVGVFAQKKDLTMEEVTEVIGFLRDDVTRELMEGLSLKISLGPPRVSRMGSGRYFTQQSVRRQRKRRVSTTMRGKPQAMRRRGGGCTTRSFDASSQERLWISFLSFMTGRT